MIEPLAGVLGISAPASAQETFWALRRGLELVATQRPIVVILDDLHWGQPMFLDLVEHLIEWVSDAPVLLLALARPELREIREALAFPGRRAAAVIELSPLDDDESRALVGGLLGGVELPEALAGRILKSSEGNPLFLGEMLRMLVDEGAIRREEQEWVAGTDLASVEVPRDDPRAAGIAHRAPGLRRALGGRARGGDRQGVLPRRGGRARRAACQAAPRRSPRGFATQGHGRARTGRTGSTSPSIAFTTC